MGLLYARDVLQPTKNPLPQGHTSLKCTLVCPTEIVLFNIPFDSVQVAFLHVVSSSEGKKKKERGKQVMKPQSHSKGSRK